jgi:hypothetical protein
MIHLRHRDTSGAAWTKVLAAASPAYEVAQVTVRSLMERKVDRRTYLTHELQCSKSCQPLPAQPVQSSLHSLTARQIQYTRSFIIIFSSSHCYRINSKLHKQFASCKPVCVVNIPSSRNPKRSPKSRCRSRRWFVGGWAFDFGVEQIKRGQSPISAWPRALRGCFCPELGSDPG